MTKSTDLPTIINKAIDANTKETTVNMARTLGAMSDVLEDIMGTVKEEIRAHIIKQFARLDIASIIQDTVQKDLVRRISELDFPEGSIPGSSINVDSIQMSGNNISGGVIRGFSSEGIEDKASKINLTILDGYVVVENKLVTKNLNVCGTTTLDGDVIINGTIPQDSKIFQDLAEVTSDRVLKTIEENLIQPIAETVTKNLLSKPLDLTQITIGGKTVFDENGLGKHVTNSNLQQVGQLRDLQVSGETLLSGSFYSGQNRVGINTTVPSCALSVWDEEVEMVLTKHKKQTGYIGTIRSQDVIIGSNNHSNIVLKANGETCLHSFSVGEQRIGSRSDTPKGPGDAGQIYLNSKPESGGWIGWVCLGGSRWLRFGAIE